MGASQDNGSEIGNMKDLQPDSNDAQKSPPTNNLPVTDPDMRASLLSLPTLSQMGEYVDDVEQFRPTQVVRSGEQGWEYILPLLSNLKEFPLESIVQKSEGGMGWVVQAVQQGLNRPVAVKISKSEALGARFEQEAELTASLKHRNIPELYFYGKVSGLPFFAMEWIEGDTLKDHQAELLRKGAKLSDVNKQMLKLIADACDAVQMAHDKGVIHRDIKPENLKVDLNGVIKVLDWGLLKISGEQEIELSQVSFGAGSVLHSGASIVYEGNKSRVVAGTLDYMSPEQARGISEVDGRSDVWGLGATLYEIVCNDTPVGFLSGEDKIAALRGDQDFVRPARALNSDIPAELESILRKALRVSPSARYESVGALGQDLRDFLDGKPVQAYMEELSSVGLLIERSRRIVITPIRGAFQHPKVAGALLLATLGLGGAAKLWTDSSERARVRAAETEKFERSKNEAIERAAERLELVQTLSQQNRIAEAVAFTSPEFLKEIGKYLSDEKAAALHRTLTKINQDLQLLIKLREISISGQKDRFNSFELATFKEFDVDALRSMSQVFFPVGLTDSEGERVAEYLKNASYTPAQKFEIIEALIQAVMTENYILSDAARRAKDPVMLKECLNRIEPVENFLVTLGLMEKEKPLRMIFAYRGPIISALEGTRAAAPLRSAFDAAPMGDLFETDEFLNVVNARLSKTEDFVTLVSSTQLSMYRRGNIIAGIFSIELLKKRLDSEVDPNRKIQCQVDLIRAYERLSDVMGENPYFLAQYGRALLQLTRSEQLLSKKNRSGIGGKFLTITCLLDALKKARAQGLEIPDDLIQDAGEACLLSKMRLKEGVELLESIADRVVDKERIRLFIHAEKALVRDHIELSYGEQLLSKRNFWKEQPVECLYVFARLIGQENGHEAQFFDAITEIREQLTNFDEDDQLDLQNQLAWLWSKNMREVH
jgi:serine/threonine protein kinase